MKTVNLREEVWQAAKLEAVRRGVSLQRLVEVAVRREVDPVVRPSEPTKEATAQRMRAFYPGGDWT